MAGVSPFYNHLPVKIRFGEGVVSNLAAVLAEEDISRAFVVLDDGLDELLPSVGTALAVAESRGIEVIRFTRAPGEPALPAVEDARLALADAGADAIVAIGGGSVIDTAKVARVCVEQGWSAAELFRERYAVPALSMALVCVPTTAGTGSEVSGGAVISDPHTGEKMGTASPNLRAAHALVDPELTWSLPASVTAHTGIDALAQAIAALVAKTRTPVGDAVGLEATRLAGRALVRAVRDGSDHAARSEMACASLLGGLAMNISDAAAEHSLGQALGGVFHLPHGLTIGLVLAETLERERQHVPEQLERVADALGAPDDGSGDGSRAVRRIQDILANLELPVMRDVGVSEAHLDDLTQRAMADFFITQSPVAWTADEVRGVFVSALALESRSAAKLDRLSDRRLRAH
jgi:choline dehydrogenase